MLTSHYAATIRIFQRAVTGGYGRLRMVGNAKKRQRPVYAGRVAIVAEVIQLRSGWRNRLRKSLGKRYVEFCLQPRS
jgi:hypothetical protein